MHRPISSTSTTTTNSTLQNISPTDPPGSGFLRSMLYTNSPPKKFNTFVPPLNNEKMPTAPSSIKSASLRGNETGSISPNSPIGSVDPHQNNDSTRVFQPNETYSIL